MGLQEESREGLAVVRHPAQRKEEAGAEASCRGPLARGIAFSVAATTATLGNCAIPGDKLNLFPHLYLFQ